MTGSLLAPRHARRRAGAWRAGDTRRDSGPAASDGAETGTEPGGPPLLTVSGLSLSYGRLRALHDIDLSVRSGELVALAGENGAGKTTLVRCIAGDVVPASGEIYLGGKRVPPDPGGAARVGLAVVWQDLALCDNLDIAANIMLGQESKRLMLSETRFHAAAAELLNELRIPLKDTTRSVQGLSGGQRQLVAVARAMGRRPRLLALDEPTAALGVQEAAQVEELIMSLREQGTTILLACHDIDQMFRLADRIVVLRQGRVVADLRPADTHPDDVVALLSGQQIDSSARHQLTRLHGLTDRLVSANPSSSLTLILSALGAALVQRAAVHPPGQRPDAVLRRLARLHARRARTVGPAAVRSRRRPGGPGRGRRAPGDRRQRAGRRGLAELPRPGQDGQRGQLVVGSGARAERAQRRDHGLPHAAWRPPA